MTVRAAGCNPAILVWARETAGLTTSDVAERLGRSVETVEAWERGEALPTFSQLERLASSLYKRPVAVFFFPSPPEEEDFQEDLRTLPRAEFEQLHSDTRLALREARAFQVSLTELSRNVPPRRLITADIDASTASRSDELAREARSYLGVSLDVQRSWRNTVGAFKAWRLAFEEAGIHVFKRPFEQASVSGFCLHDDTYPVIMVNNSTAFTRQTFTLFHELGHLLYDVSGITSTEVGLERRLGGEARDIEIKCNQFAAEALVPSEAMPWRLLAGVGLEPAVEEIAATFSVSREVVLRKFRDRGEVQQDAYEELAQRWIDEAEAARRGSSSGGNYYANQATYLGDSFITLGFDQLRAGTITLGELADHFKMKATTVERLEQYILDRQAS